MGVILRKSDSYTLKSVTGNRIFYRDVPVFDISEQDQKYLLKLGYFHFIPSPNEATPTDIKKADLNIKLLKEGVIDGKGNVINHAGIQAAIPTAPKIVDLYLDDNNEPVYAKPGESCLDKDSAELLDVIPKNLTNAQATKQVGRPLKR